MRKTFIQRLYEADDIQQPAQLMTPPPVQPDQTAQPAMQPMEQPTIQEVPSFDEFQNHGGDQEQAALPQPDVMTLSVKELLDRCQSINPLICMGLQQFIDTNKDQILATASGGQMEQPNQATNEPEVDVNTDDTDLNFSAQTNATPDFSLDQPDQELDFPQE